MQVGAQASLPYCDTVNKIDHLFQASCPHRTPITHLPPPQLQSILHSTLLFTPRDAVNRQEVCKDVLLTFWLNAPLEMLGEML